SIKLKQSVHAIGFFNFHKLNYTKKIAKVIAFIPDYLCRNENLFFNLHSLIYVKQQNAYIRFYFT
ncbi:hypothetical protein, partial [Streptococcus merionis]|uniref:hypothetical protein n=1 Tax=Streptococcus merionis TaxID=400065 RepID=UPI0026F14EB3